MKKYSTYINFLSTFKKQRFITDEEMRSVHYDSAILNGDIQRFFIEDKDGKIKNAVKLTDNGKFLLKLNGNFSFLDTVKDTIKKVFHHREKFNK